MPIGSSKIDETEQHELFESMETELEIIDDCEIENATNGFETDGEPQRVELPGIVHRKRTRVHGFRSMPQVAQIVAWGSMQPKTGQTKPKLQLNQINMSNFLKYLKLMGKSQVNLSTMEKVEKLSELAVPNEDREEEAPYEPGEVGEDIESFEA